ncbi:glycosyltransferase family 1 protein [Venturia nashicola]|uniref:UDP-N-acetylglucosamine transferase subunit ALG13 n=1 Tax=Venturia nashicola TaxID=86259 RepID=A0A4Z1NT71_9PEZI|nr:glycosyltransferase family 1 protein [Venturia nashicola]
MSLKKNKVCFVTIGATASFPSLIRAVLSPSFLHAASSHDYTKLIIQFGRGGDSLFKELCMKAQKEGPYGLTVEGFDLTNDMMGEMRVVKASAREGRQREEGIVLCHAGTGSVLDALRLAVPVIVVPNPELLDNHQEQFAEVMEKMEYAVHGSLDNLPAALTQSETLRKKSKEWPPVNSGMHRQANGLAGVIDEELGFLD